MKRTSLKDGFKEEISRISFKEEFRAMAVAMAISAPLIGVVGLTSLKDILRNAEPAVPYCSVLAPGDARPCEPEKTLEP